MKIAALISGIFCLLLLPASVLLHLLGSHEREVPTALLIVSAAIGLVLVAFASRTVDHFKAKLSKGGIELEASDE
jgi:hypothetical protein